MNTMTKRSVANLAGLGLIALGSIAFLAITGHAFLAITGHLLPYIMLTPIVGLSLFPGALISSKRETELDERDKQIGLKSSLIGSGVSWFCLAATVSALGHYNHTIEGHLLGYALPGSAYLLFLAREISFLIMSRRSLPNEEQA